MVTVPWTRADEQAVTIPGFDGDVSVDDRASECLTAIARTYEEGLAHLEFLARLWAEPIKPPVPALPVMTPIADEPAEPVVAVEPAAPLPADEPAMLPVAVVAADAPAPVAADAPTAVELPVVLTEPALEAADEPEADDIEADDVRVLLFAEAATAEIPVQVAA